MSDPSGVPTLKVYAARKMSEADMIAWCANNITRGERLWRTLDGKTDPNTLAGYLTGIGVEMGRMRARLDDVQWALTLDRQGGV